MENFPKLQEEARKIANERADELCKKVLSDLATKGINNLTAFSEPDVQYVILEAQKKYARFGNQGLLDSLSELISSRIQNDDKTYYTRIIDKALLAACELSENQLDCLSALFILTRVRFNRIHSIDDLENHYQYLIKVFNLEGIQFRKYVSYLNCLNCLDLTLPDVIETISRSYQLPVDEVKRVTPHCISQFTGDYGVSDIGILLAIVNAEKKTAFKFNPFIWIPEN